ncbi:MAG: hypothetical protein LBV55_02350, partial [Acholeplasmatales bacterium]|nr:hypothetical protein [Acholeplasmatales bacterium]
LDFYTHCSSGTYIRQIGSDLARLTHNLGTISVLRRLRVGNFKVEDARPLEEITFSNLIPITALFADLPHLSFNDYILKLIKNGASLDQRHTTINSHFWATDETDNLIALYAKEDDEFIYHMVIVL